MKNKKAVNLKIKEYIKQRDNNICRYCLRENPEFLEIDHIVPRWVDGSNHVINLVSCCRACNQDRRTKHTKDKFKKFNLEINESMLIIHNCLIEGLGPDTKFDSLLFISQK